MQSPSSLLYLWKTILFSTTSDDGLCCFIHQYAQVCAVFSISIRDRFFHLPLLDFWQDHLLKILPYIIYTDPFISCSYYNLNA